MTRLRKYQTKREFEQTPEPQGKVGQKKTPKSARFCVQRHKARLLHFDLRLELDGVLVSFAIPKGPSMHPEEKRLAIHVEDHPLEYIDFEGVIPAGNYGAGEVEIWDRGIYEADKKAMREGLKVGHLSFKLFGDKLQGRFAIIRLGKSQKDEWLFFKIDESDEKKPDSDASKKVPFPKWYSPMLAQLIEKPFDAKDWLFEVKWDGYRAIAFVNKDRVELWSRNHKSYNHDFPLIVGELKNLNRKLVLDGEVVVLDRQGVSRFELLQACPQDPDCDPYFMIFDLLYVDGIDLRARPLVERKRLLAQLSPSLGSRLRLSDHIEDRGVAFFKEAKTLGLEGIIGKRMDSVYVSRRSMDWVKIKTRLHQEFVIAGFTKPKGNRARFGALILGVYSAGVLKFVGHVGTGFDQRTIEEVYKKMKPLIRTKCPFENVIVTNGQPTWIRPQLLAEVSFSEWTAQGFLRQPVFHGLRFDKDADEVGRDIAVSIDERAVATSNRQKVFWKKEGYTKGDLLLYYETVAPFILPHLKGRPLALNRFPDGIDGQGFFQKHLEGAPRFLKTVFLDADAEDGKKRPLIENLPSLIYVANLASIELHPMLARVDHLDCPDFLVLDLDPEALPFKSVVEVAQAAHHLLDEAGMPNFCKTSGGRGLHIYVPLGGNISHEQSTQLAQLLASIMGDKSPSLVSLERLPKKRQQRVYVDYLQNAQGKSMVAPYSLRALPAAPASTPLKWSEVKEDLDPLDFNILSIPKRLSKMGDIFAPVLEGRINLNRVLKRLEKLL